MEVELKIIQNGGNWIKCDFIKSDRILSKKLIFHIKKWKWKSWAKMVEVMEMS